MNAWRSQLKNMSHIRDKIEFESCTDERIQSHYIRDFLDLVLNLMAISILLLETMRIVQKPLTDASISIIALSNMIKGRKSSDLMIIDTYTRRHVLRRCNIYVMINGYILRKVLGGLGLCTASWRN